MNWSFDTTPFVAPNSCISAAAWARSCWDLEAGAAKAAVEAAPATSNTPANAMMFRVLDIFNLLLLRLHRLFHNDPFHALL
jgi:hypothetical protein